MAEIYVGVFRFDKAGIHDNFFKFGGHSLLARRMIKQTRIFLLGTQLRSFEFPELGMRASYIDKINRILFDFDISGKSIYENREIGRI